MTKDKSNINIKYIQMGNINIKPLGDRVVIEPVKVEEKTVSGIIIPNASQEKPSHGTVIAIPDNTENSDNKVTVKVGDKVLYGKYAGTEIEINKANYIIMSETDILAVI